MKLINYDKYDEKVYYEELDNGLKVYIFYKPDINSSYCAIGTSYGALDIYQKSNNLTYDFNPGIAHFLEHKIFEDEDGDVLDKFAKYGAMANAFTSYHETVYHFSLTGKDNFKECLNLLLDFTQKLQINEESIEKEKPIINQEISMYQALPETKLLNESFSTIFHYYPLRFDIGGDEDSVNKISLNELEECFKMNYHPSNMTLSIVSFIKPESIISIIKNNQSKKLFNKIITPTNNTPKEPKEVLKKEKTFTMDISSNKNTYIIKLDLSKYTSLDIIRMESSIRMILTSLLTNLNPMYQKWLDNKLINDFFGFDLEFSKEGSYIIFYSENNTASELKELIDNTLENFILNDKIVTQLKRRFIGNFFDEFNDLEGFNTIFLRNILDDINFFDLIKVYQDLTVDIIMNDYNKLDFNNYSLISLKPQK